MKIYFAPMEGTTDAVFRRVHHRCFGGVERYFIPFVSPTQNRMFTSRELKTIGPEANQGVPVVPQLLGKDASHLLWAIGELKAMGHTQVNLNLGCPSGTVTAKGKGAGLLRDAEELKRLLDELFDKTTLPLSLKTRIGFASSEEWPGLWEVLKAYPALEWIIHPRTRADFYKGALHLDAFDWAMREGASPLVYNGDLFNAEDLSRFQSDYPTIHTVMMGRGLIANPALTAGHALTVEQIRHFHDELMEEYSRIYPQDQVQNRLREIMKYVACCFDGAQKARKAMRKAQSLQAHCEAVDWLLRDFPLTPNPGYVEEFWLR